jgi:cysteine desulfurase
MHTDAAQVVGKLPVDFGRLGVSAMTVSAHKFHGPKGIGALVIRHGLPLEPVSMGGHQQGGLRAGTEPVALCVGMRVALEAFSRECDARAARLQALTKRFEQAMTSGWPGAVILGAGAARVPNVSAIALVGLDRQALIMALDQAGVACATGAACESGSSESSPTLAAMACRPEVAASGIRFSISARTTTSEIDDAVRRILRVARKLGRPRNG